jgi:POT family proton-dependent oligopeptide transporter
MSAERQPAERHPKGLYVLFFTEMWERFGFYSMLAMFTLYLQNKEQGFGWTENEASVLYSVYLASVYFMPLFGGLIADAKLGYRNSVLLGGVIFMVGYFLMGVHSIVAVYAALACLVVGNGFFKPNVSAMVGHLYPEGSPLKDRAYNLFYMGINIGAFFAPLNAGLMRKFFGYHAAFAVAGVGMIISVAILWIFRRHVEKPGHLPGSPPPPAEDAGEAAVTADVPPPRPASAMESVPESKRIGALVVIFLIVIVFWMVFHQSGSTLTYWARDNVDWSLVGVESKDDNEVFGILSATINPFWVVALSFPIVLLWNFLNRRGLEPSTPTKMGMGMVMLGLSFFLMYAAARLGEQGLTQETRYQFRVSLLWLVGYYFLATVAELMLSPMGLSLVSKVAPVRRRGLMMGGWFVATAVGNSLTVIAVFWTRWWHSTFFAVLGGMAVGMGLILFLLLRPLKKAMPGV